MVQDPKIFVVIPVFNRVEHTLACIGDFQRQTYGNFELVIIDDGSTDGTSEKVRRKFPEVTLLKGTGDLFWTGGTNVGVEYALKHARSSDYILTINNDVRITEEYLDTIVKAGRQNYNSLIGSLCVYLDRTDVIETSGFVMNWRTGFPRPQDKMGSKRTPVHVGLREITHTCGKGVLIPVGVFHDLGLYDQEHFPHYHADSAFTLKAHLAGYKVFVCYDAIVRSDTTSTGLAGVNKPPVLSEFIQSFSSIRSTNYWHARKNFARIFLGSRGWIYLMHVYGRSIAGFALRFGCFHFAQAKSIISSRSGE